MQSWQFTTENEVGESSHSGHNDQLAHQEQKGHDIVEHHHSHHVSHQQIESIFGGDAKVGALHGAHDVGVAIDESHELFQAPKAALAKANQASCQVIIVGFQLVFHVLQDGPDEPDDGNDQGTKGQGTHVKS